jgi:hypothetical protein
MKYILAVVLPILFIAFCTSCTKELEKDILHTVHDTLYEKITDTVNRFGIKTDTLIKYNSDSTRQGANNTDTLIITTTKIDTLIQIKYDTIIKIDSAIIIDTVYGMYASKSSRNLNHIKVNQFPDSVNGSYITHIYFGETEYFLTPDHFVDVPWNLQTTLSVEIMYKYGDATTVAMRDYFDPLVTYQYVLQVQGGTVGQRQDYIAQFPYVNTTNLVTITLKDNLNGEGGLFAGDYPGQGDGLNAHAHYVKPAYKRIY